jgi:cell division septum initiation protein DivIVA
MPNKMERFSQRARRVLNLAQQEAESLNHRSIGTGHLLAGLIREDQGVGGRVLRELKIDYAALLPIVREFYDNAVRVQAAAPDLSPNTKRVLEMSVKESRRMGHHHIGTEHMLMAILQAADTTAFRILERLNLDAKTVEKRVIRAVRQEERSVLRPGMKPVTSLIRQRFATVVPAQAMVPPPANAEAMKIIQMIEEGKVTPDEGERLLKALPPVGFPAPPPDRYIDLNQFPLEGDDRQLRAVITDKATDETQFYFSVPIHGAQDGLRSALNAIQQGLIGGFFTVEADDYRVDLFVDKPADEEAS